MSKEIYVRIDESLLEKLDEVAKSMGLSRSETIRLAIENFIIVNSTPKGETMTSKMRGIVRGKLTQKELDEAYVKFKYGV